MAQGLRVRAGRVAAVGVLLCTGLVGCMDTDKKPTQINKGGPGTPGSFTKGPASPATGMGMQPGGVQPAGGFQQPGAVRQAGGINSNANPYNTGTTGAGGSGSGMMMPGGNTISPATVIPPVGPVGSNSNYQPGSGYQMPAANAGYTAGQPASGSGSYAYAGQVVPAGGASNYRADPPAPALADPGPVPPSAPTGVTPSVAPPAGPPSPPVPNALGPIAPPGGPPNRAQ